MTLGVTVLIKMLFELLNKLVWYDILYDKMIYFIQYFFSVNIVMFHSLCITITEVYINFVSDSNFFTKKLNWRITFWSVLAMWSALCANLFISSIAMNNLDT